MYLKRTNAFVVGRNCSGIPRQNINTVVFRLRNVVICACYKLLIFQIPMYCVMVPVAPVSAGPLTFLVFPINEIVLYCNCKRRSLMRIDANQHYSRISSTSISKASKTQCKMGIQNNRFLNHTFLWRSTKLHTRGNVKRLRLRERHFVSVGWLHASAWTSHWLLIPLTMHYFANW